MVRSTMEKTYKRLTYSMYNRIGNDICATTVSNKRDIARLKSIGYKIINKRRFGNRIKRIRVFNNWSQKKMAEYLNIPYSSYRRLETGKISDNFFTEKNIKHIANKLHVTADYLLTARKKSPTVKLGRITNTKHLKLHVYKVSAFVGTDKKACTALALARNSGDAKLFFKNYFNTEIIQWINIQKLIAKGRLLQITQYEDKNIVEYFRDAEDENCRLNGHYE
ncbi:MAG: XRE family transcriptional regulator [Bacteroidetes bacterium]|nr:MAG: XRE family transcriptional regulator [Bacteroidota bacterium]